MVVVRDGRLPVGAAEVVAEAGGRVVVVGRGAEAAARALAGVTHGRWADTGPGFRPGRPGRRPGRRGGRRDPRRAPRLARRPGPGSPPGRRHRPAPGGPGPHRGDGRRRRGPGVRRPAVARVDDRVLVPVEVPGPAVVTLAVGGGRPTGHGDRAPRRVPCVESAGPRRPAGRRRPGPTPSWSRCSSPTSTPWTWPTPPGWWPAGPDWWPGWTTPGHRGLRPAGGGGRRPRRLGRGHPGGHRRRVDRLRAPDRHHRGHRRPGPLRGPRRVGRRPAHRRSRRAPPRGQRQHRPVVPDDGHGRPRPGDRRPARCWSSWPAASASRRPPDEPLRGEWTVPERRRRSTPWWSGPDRPGRRPPWPWPGPGARWCWSSGAPSRGRRTSTAGWSTAGCSTTSSPGGGRRSRSSGGSCAGRP